MIEGTVHWDVGYALPLVPGPTRPTRAVQDALKMTRPSSDLSPAFAELYARTQSLLRRLVHAPPTSTPVIQVGEGLMGLWSAIKSLIPFRPITIEKTPNGTNNASFKVTRVLCVSNGIYGSGFKDMVKSIGAHLVHVELCESPFNGPIDLDCVERQMSLLRPDIVTAVHCETPTGLLNPLSTIARIGKMARDINALFVVDIVSSAGGVPVNISAMNIDVACMGAQKVFGVPPPISMVIVCERAWETIRSVQYQGYDALHQWDEKDKPFPSPYTHWWEGVAALHASLVEISVDEEAIIKKHRDAQEYVLKRAIEMGLTPFIEDASLRSPTCTSLMVPSSTTWEAMQRELVGVYGVGVAGSYSPYQGKLFRIGHMGIVQTEHDTLTAAIDAIDNVLNKSAK